VARKDPVVVMNRDQPEALLVHLDDEKLLKEHGVRVALATALYRSESLSPGKAAKLVGMALGEFMRHVSRLGIAVVRGGPSAVREDTKTLEEWLGKPSSATRAR
jgi:predicted HTH domain antitoxin